MHINIGVPVWNNDLRKSYLAIYVYLNLKIVRKMK